MTTTTAPSGQRGFTLAELIIVILIIGVLSTLALSRFTNRGSDARTAKAQSIMDAVRLASQAVRAVAERDKQTGPTDTVTMDGISIATAYGYPQAIQTGNGATGIVDVAGMDTSGKNNDGITLAGGGTNPLVIEVNGAATPAKCSVSYTTPASVNATPTITLTTTGC